MVSVKNEKGYILLLTIVLYAVTLMLCASLFTLLAAEMNNQRVMEQREIATYIAHSGIEHAVSILENESSPSPPPESCIVYEAGDIIGEYRILELDNTQIVSRGRLIRNGDIIYEVTMKAKITEDGVIHLL